jgi:hypothetical protein
VASTLRPLLHVRRAGAAVLSVFLMAVEPGCRCPVPGDGRLVLVTLDDRILEHLVGVALTDRGVSQPLGPFVARGARYWDSVGARLRTPDQLADYEWNEAPSARTVHVEPTNGIEHAFDGAIAFYSDLDGFIRVDLSNPELDPRYGFYRPIDFESLFAHELGHALGLDHEPGCSGVMSPGCSLESLSSADVAQFRSVWPGSRP